MTQKHKHIKGLAHHLPHRTRYRVGKKHRNETSVKRIRDSVMAVPGVKSVEVNDRTGSVLVHHEERSGMLDALSAALGGVGEDIFEELIETSIEEIVPGGSIIAHLIKQRVGSVNASVAGLTNNVVDLKMLLPMGFLTAGIIQASRNRNWFAQVPAWVLFYYAYDSYLKFHGPSVRLDGAQPGGNGPVLRLTSAGSE